SLIDFDDAAEFVHVFFNQGCPNTVAHIPSSFERSEAHVAPELAGAHSFFACQHQVSDLEPVPQGLVRVLENSASNVRETIAGRAAGGAGRALPMVPGSQRIDLRIATAGAMDALRPAASDQIGDAML